MALINCPECNKQVSEHAQTCPNCGVQIERYFYQKAREAKQKEQQETWNKKIAEREKQKQLRIKKFKKHKIGSAEKALRQRKTTIYQISSIIHPQDMV